jgi:ABC-type glutathione transport system ATPase component
VEPHAGFYTTSRDVTYLSADSIAEKAGAATSSTAPPFVCTGLATVRAPAPSFGRHLDEAPDEATVGRRAAAVALARALAKNPHLLLADEPTRAIHAEPNRDLEPQGPAR